jgi:hypothetical protein
MRKPVMVTTPEVLSWHAGSILMPDLSGELEFCSRNVSGGLNE